MKKNITPYIHMMTKHCPNQMRSLGGIKRFSGQGESVTVCLLKFCISNISHNIKGTEKNNDDARRNYFSSNHIDLTKEILVTEARLESLVDFRREKRGYKKVGEEYWSEEIFTKRRHT